MDRPVFLGLLAIGVVVAAGFGALEAGTGTGVRAGSGTGPDDAAFAAESSSGRAGTTETRIPPESRGTNDREADPSSAGSTDPPTTAAAYPPGTSPEGITGPSKLLAAHTDALSESGFVVRSTVNATVLESGMPVDATARGGARVAAGVSAYYAHRTDAAGPLRRHTEGWYAGSIEHRRRVGGFGDVSESRRKARSIGELAGRPLLVPHLRGGAWNAVAVRRVDGDRRLVFRTTVIETERAIEDGLPDATTTVRSYEARIVVDSTGRIRSLTATAGYVIDGERTTYRLNYDLSRVGNASIERPEWAERPANREGETHRGGSDGDSGASARFGSPLASVAPTASVVPVAPVVSATDS
jgi:hypothetical protein